MSVLHLMVFFIIVKIVCNFRRTIQPYILVLDVLKVVQFLMAEKLITSALNDGLSSLYILRVVLLYSQKACKD